MKRLSALVGLVLALCVSSARAQSPDDQYVRIYNLIQQGDTLNNPQQAAEALPKYLEAQAALQKLQKINPDWNPKVVNYRLNYLAEKIAGLTSQVPPPVSGKPPGPGAKPAASTATPALVPASAVAELERQMTSFQNELSRLQADKTVLEAKLKEALATQPAAIDPRELAKAQAKTQSLLKENELLKTSLANEQAKPAPVADTKVLDETKLALAEANRRLIVQTERANTLATEKSALQKRTEELTASAVSPAELASAKSALAEANRKLAAQTEAAGKLSTENSTLQSRVATLAASAEAAETLRVENQLLKKQLADVKAATSGAAAGQADDTARRLTQAEARIASLQSDTEILRLEKLALENRVRQANAAMKTAAAPPVSRDADLQRIKQLERERDDFQKKLAAATKELDSRKGKEAAAKVDELTQEISTLRTRLDVFQARAIPYSAEELALFKQPVTPPVAIADPNGNKKSINNLPAGTTALAAEAQRYFSAKEFDKAEEKYLEILRQDDKNVYTLANLAAIELEMNRLDEAEKNVKAALAGSPDDGYSLSILGYLRFRQEKYDEAVDALGRAAKFNPQSAEIQNYLGVALSHQGQRGPAETALRTAIQLDPAYGSAHNNLAVIYLTQQPPLVELARWHYQKALATGHPPNPELEKMIEQKAPAGTAP